MSGELSISVGQFSDKGRKETNQDFHGVLAPDGAALKLKGVVAAVADGVTPSRVSHVAAETAVKSLLTDYYSTPDVWSVKESGRRVIAATNSWLHAQTTRDRDADPADRGYMCTLCALVLKGRTAHVFNVGDSRVSRLSGQSLEPLTIDHRVIVSDSASALGRAMGRASDVEIDYHAVPMDEGDVFVLSTDGAHDYLDPRVIAQTVSEFVEKDDLDGGARAIFEAALAAGSPDNITVQIIRVDAAPREGASEVVRQGANLPPPPIPEPPAEFEGYLIEKLIHASTRSFVYRAKDLETGEIVALKMPGEDFRENPHLMGQMMVEEWIARRLSSPFVLKPAQGERERNFAYVVTELVDGQNLRRWMGENANPDVEVVRDVIEQIAMGLRAFHRKEMLHRDLRPENVMIDRKGSAKIIDLGSVRIAGVAETLTRPGEHEGLLGHVAYSAPEVLAGEPATWRSDQFSLGVMAYEMLTGRLPYGMEAGRVRSRAAQRALRYQSAATGRRAVPAWIDGALRKATHPDPRKRYDALSEFISDLRRPNEQFKHADDAPLATRDPVRFWQSVSLILAVAVVVLLALLAR